MVRPCVSGRPYCAPTTDTTLHTLGTEVGFTAIWTGKQPCSRALKTPSVSRRPYCAVHNTAHGSNGWLPPSWTRRWDSRPSAPASSRVAGPSRRRRFHAVLIVQWTTRHTAATDAPWTRRWDSRSSAPESSRAAGPSRRRRFHAVLIVQCTTRHTATTDGFRHPRHGGGIHGHLHRQAAVQQGPQDAVGFTLSSLCSALHGTRQQRMASAILDTDVGARPSAPASSRVAGPSRRHWCNHAFYGRESTNDQVLQRHGS